MTFWQASEIRRRWSEGQDTYEISEALGLPEWRVEKAVYDWIRIKREKVPA